MFYQMIEKLCHENNMSPTTFVESELKMSRSNVTKWKEGKVPKADTLSKIANYFNVSTDYLLGEENHRGNILIRDEHDNPIVLDDEALDIINEMRSRPDLKMLFSVSKKATADDIIKAVKIIEALKEESEN